MRIRGKVLEVEVDHRKMAYVDFIQLVNRLGGRVVFKDGWWPVAKYRVVMPRKRARDLLRALREGVEEAQSSED